MLDKWLPAVKREANYSQTTIQNSNSERTRQRLVRNLLAFMQSQRQEIKLLTPAFDLSCVQHSDQGQASETPEKVEW